MKPKFLEEPNLRINPDDGPTSFVTLLDGLFTQLIYETPRDFDNSLRISWNIYWNGLVKMKHLLTEKIEVIILQAANRGRLTNDAIERDNNMTDQPPAQLTVGSFKRDHAYKTILYKRLRRLLQSKIFNFPVTL